MINLVITLSRGRSLEQHKANYESICSEGNMPIYKIADPPRRTKPGERVFLKHRGSIVAQSEIGGFGLYEANDGNGEKRFGWWIEFTGPFEILTDPIPFPGRKKYVELNDVVNY